eukprot:3668636-Amphidinium_carterae.1
MQQQFEKFKEKPLVDTVLFCVPALVLVISRTFAETDLVPLADTVNTEPLVQHNVRQTWKSNAQDAATKI